MIKIQHPSKPMNYYRLSDETWDSLSLKEKDYLILVNEKKHTKEQLMRRLYIESRVGYYLLITNIKKKIDVDVKKLNRLIN